MRSISDVQGLPGLPDKLVDDMLTTAIPSSTVVRAAARGGIGIVVTCAAVFAWCREKVRP